MRSLASKTLAGLAMLLVVLAVFAAIPVKASETGTKANAASTATINGYIKSKADLSPVGGIEIHLYDVSNANDTAVTYSGKDGGGSYQFNGISPGYYQVRIKSQKNPTDNKVYFGDQTDTWPKWVPRLGPSEVRREVDFNLTEKTLNAHLSGKVTIEKVNGDPAQKAKVTIVDPVSHYKPDPIETADNGTFDIDLYEGNFAVDIRGGSDKPQYSYSGTVSLTADGEHNMSLAHSNVVDNPLNPKVIANVYRNSEVLTESVDYVLNYTAGKIYFYDDGNQEPYLKLNNRDVIKADYVYLGSQWTKFSDTLTAAWNETPVLYFNYSHITNVLYVMKGIAPNLYLWPEKGNYTVDKLNGTLTIGANSTINRGEQVTARYTTVEVEKKVRRELVGISGENKRTFPLSKYWIDGYAVNETGELFITNVTHTTLYDMNDSKLFQSTTDGVTNYFTISVPASAKNHSFILVIHPDGYYPRTWINYKPAFGMDGRCSLGQISFIASEKELFKYKTSFLKTTDWNNITMEANKTWQAGSNFPGIGDESMGDLSQIGNLRLQIDLKFGNGNGKLEKSELQAFTAWLEKITPDYVSTEKFVTLNDTAYNSTIAGRTVKITDLAGDNAPVDSTKPIEVNTSVKAMISGKRFSSPKYDVKMTVDFDTTSRNSTYTLSLPPYYVRTSQNPDVDNLNMDGYTNITIDPKESTMLSMLVDMTVEKAQDATPGARILTWNGKDAVENETHAYLVPDLNNTYLVAYNRNVTFSGESSAPTVGDITGYRWHFGDNTDSGWIENKTTAHKYVGDIQKMAGNLKVWLEVKNSLGNITKTNATQNITVRLDSQKPTAAFETDMNKSHQEGVLTYTVVKQNVTKGLPKVYIPNNRTLFTWVGQDIIFNATKSYDDMLYIVKDKKGDKNGTIRYWRYDFGNGNLSGNLTSAFNYTFAGYDKPGMYNVTLNVTDVVGLSREYKIAVVVKAIPGYIKMDEKLTATDTLEENIKYFFAANASRGPFSDTISNKNYTWKFQCIDDTSSGLSGTRTGMFVDFIFKKNGGWNITLNTTDIVGNYAVNTTRITIMPGPHPDVQIMSAEFSTDNAEEGVQLTINVNISNSPIGKPADATSVVVKAYDDKDKDGKAEDNELIGSAYTYNSSSTCSVLKPKQWVLAKIRWTPDGSTEHVIIVNVTCKLGEELSSTMFNNNITIKIYVNPAKWKTWALMGGTIAAIIIAVVLIYLWKTGRFKNFRRKRREKLDAEVSKGKDYKEKYEKGGKK